MISIFVYFSCLQICLFHWHRLLTGLLPGTTYNDTILPRLRTSNRFVIEFIKSNLHQRASFGNFFSAFLSMLLIHVFVLLVGTARKNVYLNLGQVSTSRSVNNTLLFQASKSQASHNRHRYSAGSKQALTSSKDSIVSNAAAHKLDVIKGTMGATVFSKIRTNGPVGFAATSASNGTTRFACKVLLSTHQH